MTVVSRKQFHTEGGLKELFRLFCPILLMTFTSCLFLLVEKLLLARLSIKDMEAAVNATYACQIFQIPCIALAMMTQVYVGRWHGAKDWPSIGPGVWQFIWFSLFSILVTIPCSLFYGVYYFKGTGVEQIVMPYFYVLVGMNFLYPLTTTLSCFYLGQGKTRLVVFGTIGSQVVKLVLAFLFIFGIKDWFPAFGLLGGAISTLLAQAGFCFLLFGVFLNSGHAKIYQSREWAFKPRLFWECIQPGILRGLNRILSVLCWASIAHLMSAKGGDYILILSIGGTLFLFLPFIGDAICQAQTTVVSYILGAKAYHLMNRAFRSGLILVIAATLILSIPLLLFPNQTFHYLFPSIILEPLSVQKLFGGVWICFVFATYSYVPISYILAFKDTKFSLFMGAVSWINGYLLMYLIIEKGQIPANQFWIALSLMHGSTALFYYWRMKWLQKSVMQKSSSLTQSGIVPAHN